MSNKQKIMSCFLGITFFLGNRLSLIYRFQRGNVFQKTVNTINGIGDFLIGPPSLHIHDVLTGLCFVGGLILFLEMKKDKKVYRKGEEYGSAKWGTKEDIKPFLAKNEDNRVLLSASESLMINEKPKDPKNNRNLNVLVIGGSGSGKTRFVVKPNLMQLNSSFVVTDPKGSLIRETGTMFKEAGYQIKFLDLINLSQSMCYNPLLYIKNESDILKFVDYLMANTQKADSKSSEPLWDNAEKLLYMAYLGLMLETCQSDSEFTMEMLLWLVNESQISDDEGQQNIVDEIFEEHEAKYPDSFAVAQYKKYKIAAGKTAKSIMISVSSRLAPFELPEVKRLMAKDEINIKEIGDKKTIFYLMVSDTSPTFNFIAGILYSQMFNILIEHADRQDNYRLKYPVQFVLDEFANTGKIPKFERLIATIRSRGISVMPVLQSLSQLKSTYKEATDTIVGNCDTTIFLGGKEEGTLKSISQMLGKQTIDITNRNKSYGQQKSWSDNNSLVGRELLTPAEIAMMDNSQCIVQIRGLRPFLSSKFPLEKHKRYGLLHENENDGRIFKIDTYLKSKYSEESKNVVEIVENKSDDTEDGKITLFQEKMGSLFQSEYTQTHSDNEIKPINNVQFYAQNTQGEMEEYTVADIDFSSNGYVNFLN
ncbi:type IV secretory system conjugative DNA transfer family protein [Aerococcus sp. UMB8608]|uniref:VirD4-like conjugal transfer protein, CD1115 family n=1 Tax=Aerococcus sp. UMB8608 TaxID=3046347 RepID=UPI00254B78CB|nr:type IV secretory system conjugative DNA transfer family protein [Aerococcus sp. UMB8608]MDK6679193.1 type IV secretory system conjugative DNA transfer family protein [Aerococcus sp. UMB8608]